MNRLSFTCQGWTSSLSKLLYLATLQAFGCDSSKLVQILSYQLTPGETGRTAIKEQLHDLYLLYFQANSEHQANAMWASAVTTQEESYILVLWPSSPVFLRFNTQLHNLDCPTQLFHHEQEGLSSMLMAVIIVCAEWRSTELCLYSIKVPQGVQWQMNCSLTKSQHHTSAC